MANVLLISTAKLKKMTPIQDNLDDDIIKPYIYKSQDTHIQMSLGTDLYNKIKGDVQTGSISGNYKTLLDEYIQPMLIEWSLYEALPYISMKLTNKSIVRGNSDYSVEGDLNDLKYLRNSVRDLAEFYSQRTTNYIREYSNLFPEYQRNSGLDKIVPNSTSYFNGVYLGGGRSTDCGFGLGDKWIDLN